MPRISAEETKQLRMSAVESKRRRAKARSTENPSVVADPPKPSPKKTSPPKPSDLLIEEVGRQRRLAEAIEQLVFRRHALLVDGQDLSSAEFRLLQTVLPTSPGQNPRDFKEQVDHFLKRENLRVSTIVGLQSAAGKPADREAADELVKTTQRRLDSEGPNLEEEILKLQTKLQELRSAATDSQTAADDRHDADRDLRAEKLLPEFIRDELNAIKRDHSVNFGRELGQLEARQISLTSVIALDCSATITLPL